MTKWPKVPLDELFELRREQVDLDLSTTYTSIGIKSFGNGLFRYPPTSGAELSKIRYFRFPANALIASNIQAWEGALAVSTEKDSEECIASNRFLPYMPRDTNRVDSTFVLLYLLSDRGWAKVRAASPGTAVRNKTLSRALFEAVEVPLPPLDEQRRIAARIGEVDHLAANAAAATERMTRLHVARLLRAQIASLLDKCQDEVSVADVAVIVSDLVRPGDDLGEARSFVGLEHLAGDLGVRISSAPVGSETGRKFRFTPRDVLYGYLRPYQNKVWLADCTGLCSVEQFVLRSTSPENAELLWFALRSQHVLDRVLELTNNLQLPRLSSGNLLTTRMRWPSDSEREDAIDGLRQVQSLAVSLNDRIAKRDQLVRAAPASILNEVFSGRV